MDRIALLVLLAFGLAKPAQAASMEAWQPYISEASLRFGIPENWVRSVIQTESGGDIKAVSPKGAMGLMQLMPKTWDELRSIHALGSDPFNPHANILAGTAYLRVMYDRFGYPDLFAAYNAGGSRFEDHLRTGKQLPNETRAYVSRLGESLGFNAQGAVKTPLVPRLFFALSSVENSAGEGAANPIFVRLSTVKEARH